MNTGRRPLHPCPPKGTRFGRWTVTGNPLSIWKKTQNVTHYQVTCDCGYKTLMLPNNLWRGLSTQCAECSFIARRKPPVLCFGCGVPIGNQSKRCRSCHIVDLGKSKLGVPARGRKGRKMTLAQIGKIIGISKQGASYHEQKYGHASLMRRVAEAKKVVVKD